MTGATTPRPRPRPRPRPGPRPAPTATPEPAGAQRQATPPPERLRGAAPRWLLPALAAFVVAALVAVDAWLAVVHADRRHAAHRAAAGAVPVVQADSPVVTAAQRNAITAARRRVPAMLTYDYRRLDAFLRQAPANATGPYKADFTRLIQTVIGPAATRDQVTANAEIKTVAVVEAHADQVQLLIFVDQTTTSRVGKTGRVAGGRLTVTMTRAGNTWLVADLTAV